MATTTAKLTIISPDLIDSQTLSLAATMTMTKEASATGLTNTSGLARKVFANTSITPLFDGSAYGDGAHKIYIRNLETTLANHFLLTINATAMGRIEAGDWVLLPWRADANDLDINLTAAVAGSALEYMLFYE